MVLLPPQAQEGLSQRPLQQWSSPLLGFRRHLSRHPRPHQHPAARLLACSRYFTLQPSALSRYGRPEIMQLAASMSQHDQLHSMPFNTSSVCNPSEARVNPFALRLYSYYVGCVCAAASSGQWTPGCPAAQWRPGQARTSRGQLAGPSPPAPTSKLCKRGWRRYVHTGSWCPGYLVFPRDAMLTCHHTSAQMCPLNSLLDALMLNVLVTVLSCLQDFSIILRRA